MIGSDGPIIVLGGRDEVTPVVDKSDQALQRW